jgi:glycylpeptide N-tetradecanoyltransferase
MNDIKFKILNISHIDQIYQLLNCNYFDTSDSIKILFPKKYLKWYLQNSLIIGMVYNHKLIGITSIKKIPMIIENQIIPVNFMGLTCINRKIRCNKLHQMLDDYVNKIAQDVWQYRIQENENLHESDQDNDDNQIVYQEFIVPVNHIRLINLGLILPDEEQYPVDENPFTSLKKQDLEQISLKLSNLSSDIRPYFTPENCKYYFLPQQNVIYSFVIRNQSQVTDFVSVYKKYMYCEDYKSMLVTAYLSFYSLETLTETEMLILLIDKLKKYGFDQLIFNDQLLKTEIGITKFITNNKFGYNIPEKMSFFPFT